VIAPVIAQRLFSVISSVNRGSRQDVELKQAIQLPGVLGALLQASSARMRTHVLFLVRQPVDE
jgi:hypothetical protein